MSKTKTWPRLYGEASKGNTKEWQITAHEGSNGTAYTSAEFGGTGNKMQTTRKEIVGKNIGRVNETTAYEQALLEAESDFKKKVKKGYRESIKALRGTVEASDMTAGASNVAGVGGKPILPMLAHSYKKRGKDIQWPAIVQAKIDGHRAYGTGGVLLSRGGDPVPGLVNMPRIQKELKKLAGLLPEGTWYDGELYSEEIPFEKLCGCIRRSSLKEAAKPLLPLVKYYIFDLFDPKREDWVYSDRRKVIDLILDDQKKFEHIVEVPTYIADDERELLRFHNQYVLDGFEGAIIRNLNGHYKIGHRSKDLQKFKQFQDAEFKIVNFKEGTGSDAGSVVWTCEVKHGYIDLAAAPATHRFDVRPVGSIEYRKELFQNGRKHIGKMLTVRYQNLSEYGIPRFPVGKGIREKGE